MLKVELVLVLKKANKISVISSVMCNKDYRNVIDTRVSFSYLQNLIFLTKSLSLENYKSCW